MTNDRKPHIGFLTERMTLGFGVDVVIHEQAKRLAQRGYRVTVFTGWKTDLHQNLEYELVCLSQNSEHVQNLYSPEFMKQAFSIINRYDVDLWMIHTPPFYAWRYCLKSPAIMVEHGTPPGKFFGYKHGKNLDSLTRKRQHYIFRNLRQGDALIAISEYIKSGLPSDVQRLTVVNYNGADHYPKANAKDISDFRHALGMEDSDILVLWVGRIQLVKDPQPYKGLQCLLRIADKLTNEKTSIRFVAVGRGNPASIPMLENVGILPLLNQPAQKMSVIYAAADLFLNTSLWEGFNLPLVEAQFQGTPVIALKICAHPEVVSNGHSGVLVHSLSDLAKAVLRLSEDETTRKKMRESAVWHASQFTWDRNVDRLEKTIQGCLKIASSPAGARTEEAKLEKSLGYYRDYTMYLYQHFGWKTLIREFIGFVKRRVSRKK